MLKSLTVFDPLGNLPRRCDRGGAPVVSASGAQKSGEADSVLRGASELALVRSERHVAVKLPNLFGGRVTIHEERHHLGSIASDIELNHLGVELLRTRSGYADSVDTLRH